MEGKITKIEVQKRKKDRVNIYIDDEYCFSCSAELIFSHSLKTGNSANIQELQDLVTEDNYIKAKNYALKVIERNCKSEDEIYKKLALKDYGELAINKVMEFLKEYGLVDDVKYTEMYVNEKCKTQGKKKIKYELLRKGISEEIIDSKISSVNEINLNNLSEVMKKKYEVLSRYENNPLKLYKKMYSFLMSKGYSYDEFNAELKQLINID